MNDDPKTLTFSQLQALTGYHSRAAVERCLKRQRVPFLIGKNGPFTTLDALHQALGVRQDRQSIPRIDF